MLFKDWRMESLRVFSTSRFFCFRKEMAACRPKSHLIQKTSDRWRWLLNECEDGLRICWMPNWIKVSWLFCGRPAVGQLGVCLKLNLPDDLEDPHRAALSQKRPPESFWGTLLHSWVSTHSLWVCQHWTCCLGWLQWNSCGCTALGQGHSLSLSPATCQTKFQSFSRTWSQRSWYQRSAVSARLGELWLFGVHRKRWRVLRSFLC